MRTAAKGFNRLEYAKWFNDYVILSIQVESVEAVTNIQKLAKPVSYTHLTLPTKA